MITLNNINQKSILVIGDVMLDIYFYGEIKRISPEAPVPVFKKKSESSVLGGAANVAANLIAAGQAVSIMSIVGNDTNGKMIKEKFERLGIDTKLLVSLERNTTVKTRFMTNSNQQVLRLDIEDTEIIDKANCEKMLVALEKRIKNFDLILLSDYLKGLFSYDFTQGVIQLAKEYDVPVIVDVKDPKIEKYKDAYLLKPNLNEIRTLTGIPAKSNKEIIEASEKLREMCNCKYVLTTCGAQGMVLIGEEEPYFIEAVGREVFDVTGAGDTTIAYLGTCLANSFPVKEAVEIANYAAGIQVSKVGTSSVYWREVREYLSEKKEGSLYKLLNMKAIKTFRKDHSNQKIVFTNGCFDILHIGHIRYLQESAKLGDILVIGINSDESIRRLKGSERPINSEKDRAELLCALGFVDYVVIFKEDTPFYLISEIQPDIIVKGGDYRPDQVVGKDIVEARGGKLVLIPFIEGKSTTNIINKIKE